MKGIVLLITLFTLLVGVPCYALDLDSEHLIDNVIKSLDEERDRWIVRGRDAFYINGHVSDELRDKSWPEYDDRCLVQINYIILRPTNHYISFKKPVEMDVNGNDRLKLVRKLRQVMYEDLHNRYNTRMPKKEIVLKEKPPEKKEKKTTGGSNKL